MLAGISEAGVSDSPFTTGAARWPRAYGSRTASSKGRRRARQPRQLVPLFS